ncbi:GNAT family N-acetyltransferase [Flavobacterium sp.]|uniref:GNAT family N-acetyltransferase n=1 Tax=Flavobacterium sp. TaxID=239 RepID=UPI0039E67A62
MDPITIRMAVAEDFQTVYRFINLLEDDTFNETTQHLLFAENLANPNVVYLIAFADEKPVGLLSCHIQNLLHHAGKVGEIQEMYVEESARSLGVGKKLIDALKAIAQQRNLVQLEVTSSFKRADAHRFYERENFIFTHKKFTLPLK